MRQHPACYGRRVPGLLLWIVLVPAAGAAVTFVAGRLLGARRGWLSLLVAGTCGWLGAILIAGVLTDWDWSSVAMIATSLVLGTVFTMMVAVGLDLFAPQGSLAAGANAGLVTVTNPVTGMRQKIEPFRRYREVIDIARRNGALPAHDSESLPAAIRRTLEEAGGIFVKLGQVASTRTDVLPPEWCRELTLLRSSAEPCDEAAMRPHITAEIGAPPEEIFADFDWTPLASASIAQVYRARLETHGDVVVKVQRPDLDELVERDSAAVMQLANLVERRTPLGRSVHPADMARDFLDGVREELDFRIEAANAHELAAALEDSPGLRVPTVHDALSGRRILVEEFVSAPPIGAVDQLRRDGIDVAGLAQRLIRSFLEQIFDQGVYHADPHPGNILVEPDGTIVLIDLGSVGRLGPGQRTAVLEMMAAASSGSASQLRQAMSEITILPRNIDTRVLDADIDILLARHLRAGRGITTAAFEDLAVLIGSHGLRLPRWFGTLSRTLVTLEGTLKQVDPDFSLVDAARSYAEQQGLSAPSSDDVQDLLTQEAIRQMPRLRRVPERVDELLTQAVAGRLSAQVSVFASRHDERILTKLVDRLVLAMLAAAVGVGSVILLAVEGGPGFRGDVTLNQVFGYVGLTAAAVLTLRVVAGVVRDGST